MPEIAIHKNGDLLSYAEFGSKDGSPVLIQHGLIASIQDSALFDRLIASGAHLICLARPGYGRSSPCLIHNMGEWAGIVSILVDRLNLAQFDVLGMSSGAPYSYAIGAKLPGKVRNIFIFSGTPALYDEEVASFWPYELKKDVTIAEMQKLAYELFFSNLSKEDLTQNDIKDSMMNNAFGIAQDLKLRCLPWGFNLSEVKAHVYMRHSKSDNNVPFITAEITSRLLPNCSLETRENDVHFSTEALDDFIKNVMAPWYEK